MPGLAGSRKILIIDDETSVADTLALIFSTNGYESRAAYSAEDAIDILSVWQPDLAIVDVMLPRMNGIEFAIVLKANYPAARVLLFSGQPDAKALLEQAWKLGYHFEILAKPLHPAFMLDAVSSILSSGHDRSTDA